MAAGTGLLQQRPGFEWLERGVPKTGLRIRAAVGLMILLLGPPLPAVADEFGLLAAIEGVAPLNDQLQACAAAYVRPRIHSAQSFEKIAENALRRCRTEEGRLRRFLAGKIGQNSSRNVVYVLRQKYRSDLIMVIDDRGKGD